MLAKKGGAGRLDLLVSLEKNLFFQTHEKVIVDWWYA
jgi:hypothetical protein